MSDDQIVLTENIASTAVETFAHAGIGSVRRLSHAVGLQDAEHLRDIGILGIRSRTKVSGRLLVNDRDTPIRAPEGAAGPVKLYARPWQLQFANPGSAHLHGTVRSSYRTQGRQRIEIDRPGEQTVVIEAPDDVRLTAGRDVGLRIVSGYVVS